MEHTNLQDMINNMRRLCPKCLSSFVFPVIRGVWKGRYVCLDCDPNCNHSWEETEKTKKITEEAWKKARGQKWWKEWW